MPKRANPFGDFSPLQLKTHVGKKEVDLGVAQDEKMKIVYEQTRQLLFKGSQKTFSNGAIPTDANDNHMTWQPTVKPVSPEHYLPGQLCFGRDGQLTAPAGVMKAADRKIQPTLFGTGSGFQFEKKSMSGSVKVPDGFCHNCSRTVSNFVLCNFCDKRTCDPCIRQCCNCGGHFCHLCSILNYDEIMERAFCLNCS